MSMLTQYQQELIHREIDGVNTPEQSVEVRKLVETQPEALSLMTSLRALDALFGQVPERAPHPRVRQLIHERMSQSSTASLGAGRAQGMTQSITSWAAQQWSGVTNLMGEFMLTKKVLIVATTVVAGIAIIGQAVTGYPPSVFDAGTIGGKDDPKDGMTGVEQAGRFKGRTMSEEDVTLSDPQIHALFQNDQVLKLVKSDVFRAAMRDDAFRKLHSSDAFHQLMSNDSYRLLLKSEAYHQLMASASYQQLMSNEASRVVLAIDANRKALAADANRKALAADANRKALAADANRNALSSDAYAKVMASDAYRVVSQSDAYAKVMSNDAYARVMSNDAYARVMSNDAYAKVMSNDAYAKVMATDAYRHLQSSDTFRAVARTQSLSEAFLSAAMRVAQ